MAKIVRLNDAIEDYRRLREGTVGVKTAAGNYRHLLRFLAHTGNLPVSHLDSKHARDWLLTRKSAKLNPNTVGHLADSSWNQAVVALRGFLKFAASQEWLTKDVEKIMYGLMLRKLTQEPRLQLTAEQLLQMIDTAVHARDRFVLALTANTALRSSEVRTLRWGDVEPEGQDGFLRVRIWKSKLVRFVPISSDLQVELDRWRRYVTAECGVPQPEWFLGCKKSLFGWARLADVPAGSTFGNPNPLTGMVRCHALAKLMPGYPILEPEAIVQRALKAMGLPTEKEGVHTVRRSVALIYFQNELDNGYDGALRATSEFLHHANVTVTERYLGRRRENEHMVKVLKGQPFLSARAQADATVIPLRRAEEG